jgi:molybdopterin converting factor small subunit
MSCTVRIPSPLRSYTREAAKINADGDTLAAVLADLDRRFPGMRFRIIDEQDRVRPHIRLFVNKSEAKDLSVRVSSRDEIHIICALSGG